MIKLGSCILTLMGVIGLSWICVLTSLHNDPWLKERIEYAVRQSCSEAIGEPVSFTIESIDFLRGTLKGSSLAAQSSQSHWSFFCSEFTINFSFLSLLKGAGIELSCAFSKTHITSRYEQGAFAIQKPFNALFSLPPFLPVRWTGWTSTESRIDIISSAGVYRSDVTAEAKIHDRAVTTSILCNDGTFDTTLQGDVEGKVIAQEIAGTMLIDVPLDDVSAYEVRSSFLAACVTRKGNFKKCVAGYSYKNKAASFQWYPESCAAFVRATHMKLVGSELKGKAEFWGSLKAFAEFFPVFDALKSDGEIDFKGEVAVRESNDFSYKGRADLAGLEYQGVKLPKVALNFLGTQSEASGTVAMCPYESMQVEGVWKFSKEFQLCDGSLRLTHACPLFSDVTLQEASCDFSYEKKGLQGTYKAKVRSAENDPYLCEGSLSSDFHTVSCEGTMNGGKFVASGDITTGMCTGLQYLKEGKKIVDLTQEKHGLSGELDFDHFKHVIASSLGYEVQGSAHVVLKPFLKNARYALGVEVNDAHIQVPFTHSLIQKARTVIEVDRAKRSISLCDVEVELSKGVFRSPSITVDFSPTGVPSFIHVPCTVESVFVSWDKDICGSLSGVGVATYKEGKWTIGSSLVLDKATVRGNLLSTYLQSNPECLQLPAMLYNALFDIHVVTRHPVSIQTSFFEAQARIDASLKGACSAPQLAGVIELVQGTIFFPYKPLYIAKGKLVWDPHMSTGPEIELLAKNKVKKYALGMQVTGSVMDPKISFDSSPHLPEPAIITLLLTGSEDASFYLAMSHVVMMHIKSILFGTPDRLSDAQKFFKSLLTPLSKVRIVPGLNEQKVIEGAIEVDITDRLRAKAQNNVNLSEDTRVEVEYAFSDEVSVKAVRDQTGSVGGELEMRWKF